jgi:hypothetical protein
LISNDRCKDVLVKEKKNKKLVENSSNELLLSGIEQRRGNLAYWDKSFNPPEADKSLK